MTRGKSVAVPTLLINGVDERVDDVGNKQFHRDIPKVKWIKYEKYCHIRASSI